MVTANFNAPNTNLKYLMECFELDWSKDWIPENLRTTLADFAEAAIVSMMIVISSNCPEVNLI